MYFLLNLDWTVETKDVGKVRIEYENFPTLASTLDE